MGIAEMRTAGTGIGIATWLILMTAAQADGIGAQTTPYVPNLDPAYVDLDLLVAEGLVRAMAYCTPVIRDDRQLQLV